jgi:hypothetical protein
MIIADWKKLNFLIFYYDDDGACHATQIFHFKLQFYLFGLLHNREYFCLILFANKSPQSSFCLIVWLYFHTRHVMNNIAPLCTQGGPNIITSNLSFLTWLIFEKINLLKSDIIFLFLLNVCHWKIFNTNLKYFQFKRK